MTFMTFMNHLLPTRSNFQPVPTHWEATPGWPGHDRSQGSEFRSHRFLSLQAVQKGKLSQHLPAAILRAPSPVPSVPMVQLCSKCTRHVETWMFAPKILPKSPRENNQLTKIAKKMIRTNPTLDTIGMN